MTRALFLVCTLLCAALALRAQSTSPAITVDDIRLHVGFLTSDDLEGRMSGSPGNVQAAQYGARLFAAWGLKPLGDNGSWFQNFEFVASVKAGPSNALAITRGDGKALSLAMDADFRPLGFSLDSSVTAPVVFAGYGISAPDQSYDDYAGLDVTGKVVIVMRYTPEGSDPHSSFARFAPLREKTRTAREKGAAALLVITGPSDDPDDVIMKLSYDQSFASSGLPVMTVKRAVVEKLLDPLNRKLADIQDSINTAKHPIGVQFPGAMASMTTEVIKVRATTANVVGFLEGSDPAMKSQVVIVGAHLDHLGWGGEGSGSMKPDAHEIHNGADDNASGTAAVLELAEACAANPTKIHRSIVFILFSGEELGTLGSAYYVEHPAMPLDSTITMVNLDMVGRLKNATLTIEGTGTSPAWEPLIKRLNVGPDGKDRFTLKLVADGYGPSDHASFYRKDIPVLFFFTGLHEDYHRPSDDLETLNLTGERDVVSFAYDALLDLAQRPDRPAFTKTQSSGPMAGGGGGFAVTLGVMPDYAWTGEGLRIDGVRTNGPAEKAGMKGGDVIVSLAGKKVMNIYDYMGILGGLKAGQVVPVEYRRDDKVVSVTVTMTRRQ
jgi:aminopeptidase YwaD